MLFSWIHFKSTSTQRDLEQVAARRHRAVLRAEAVRGAAAGGGRPVGGRLQDPRRRHHRQGQLRAGAEGRRRGQDEEQGHKQGEPWEQLLPISLFSL